MFKNYIKTALRNIQRNKTFAIINIAGLTVGIAAFILIFKVVQFQNSFDNFHPDRQKIYRVASEFQTQDGIDYSAGIGFPVAEGLRLDFPDIKQVAAIYKEGGQITINKNSSDPEKFLELEVYYTEPSFFSLFNFPFAEGNAQNAFKNPNGALMTKATATKYFGGWENAIGKTFTFKNKYLHTVTGILDDIPANSDFPLSVVLPMEAMKQTELAENFRDWVSTMGTLNVYMRMPDGMSEAQMNTQLKAFAKKHKPEQYWTDSYVLQPLSEIHFDERFGNYNGKTFSHSLINALSLIGIFLLIIACVNFINLATAQAVNRSKEVGVRKVLGSGRKQLITQFLSEIGVIVLASTLLATLTAWLVMPAVNQLLETKMIFDLFNPVFILFLILIFLITTLLSGIYPAAIMSGYSPIKALRNKTQTRTAKGISFRRGLVVFQFIIAQVLIIAMLIVVKQLHFFKNKSLGFDKASIVNVSVPTDSIAQEKTTYLRNTLLANPLIQSVSFSFGPPSSPSNWSSDFKFNHSPKSTNFPTNLKWADENYFKTFDLKMIAGRVFHPSDTVREMVVNETLLKKLGITNPNDAIGKTIDLWDGFHVGEIVGVVKDFNVYSLREPMTPVIITTNKSTYRTASIKILPGKEKTAIGFIEKLWNDTYPKEVFNYKFFDTTIENFYKSEDQLAQLYKIFAAIAIFISCLGLYGLVSFMAVQRRKEVGVRKVLGASALDIIYLMSKESTILIVVAFLIASPLAWYIMHNWLNGYSYRVNISPYIFVLAIAGSIIVALLTVGYRAIQAARANPVRSLRSE